MGEQETIYALTNMANGRVYVGRTKNATTRRSQHMSALKNGRHSVKAMQSDYNNGHRFTFRTLEVVDAESSATKERAWMKRLKSYDEKYGYNGQDGTIKFFCGKTKACNTNEKNMITPILEKIRSYCDQHDITICEFEKLCGIGNGTVDDWGIAEPKLSSLLKVAAATKTPITDWLP